LNGALLTATYLLSYSLLTKCEMAKLAFNYFSIKFKWSTIQ
jgi:hypothetical protein